MLWLLIMVGAGIAIWLILSASGDPLGTNGDLAPRPTDWGETPFMPQPEITEEEFFSAVAHGIARFEGFYQSGSLAQRNNNPGNIRADARSYRTYPTAEEGWAALVKLLRRRFRENPGWTWQDLMNSYAPRSDGNDPVRYARFLVCSVNRELTTEFTVENSLGRSLEVTHA